jgi:hypothetical protein
MIYRSEGESEGCGCIHGVEVRELTSTQHMIAQLFYFRTRETSRISCNAANRVLIKVVQEYTPCPTPGEHV